MLQNKAASVAVEVIMKSNPSPVDMPKKDQTSNRVSPSVSTKHPSQTNPHHCHPSLSLEAWMVPLPRRGPSAGLNDQTGEATCEVASPPPLSQMQGAATRCDAIAAAACAGAARGRRCVYMDGRGGRSPRPIYQNPMPRRPGIHQVAKLAGGGGGIEMAWFP